MGHTMMTHDQAVALGQLVRDRDAQAADLFARRSHRLDVTLYDEDAAIVFDGVLWADGTYRETDRVAA